MSALVRRLAVPAVVWLLLTISCFAQTQAEDPRLAQPVRIRCVNGRLHTALEHISAATGVDIRCGKDDKDWQIRELPVLVCSNDLALGRLLRAIADATHLTLSSKDGKDGKPYYRLWQDNTKQAAIDDYLQGQEAYCREDRRFLIDTWTTFKDIPESEYATPVCCGKFLAEPIARAVSKVTAVLSQEAKDWFLAGGTLRVMVADCPQAIRPDVEAALHDRWQMHYDYAFKNGSPTPKPLTDSDLAKAYIEYKTEPVAVGGISPRVTAILPGLDSRSYNPASMAHGLLQKDFKLPSEPQRPLVFGPPEPKKPYEPIWLDKPPDPMFTTKLEPIRPKDRTAKYSDAVACIADSTGWAIVAEDFQSHYICRDLSVPEKLRKLFEQEVTPQEILRINTYTMTHATCWSMDRKNKILIGRCLYWAERHQNVAPESVTEGLLNGLKSEAGIQLDDLAGMAALTHQQAEEWIWPDEDLKPLFESAWILATQSAWQAYFRLSPKLRQKAHSQEGVSLASLRPLSLEEMLSRGGEDTIRLMRADGSTTSEHPGDDWLCDARALRSLRLRVTASPDGRCTATVSGIVDGQKIESKGALGPFPIRDPRHRAQSKS